MTTFIYYFDLLFFIIIRVPHTVIYRGPFDKYKYVYYNVPGTTYMKSHVHV